MSSVPPWGVPWHGRIQNGLLHLPTDETMPFRQPTGIRVESLGDTHLIDLGRPEVATSPEDQATGKQWLNQAIISGDQIHGRPIGQGSWIYQAPDGSLWIATTDAHGRERPYSANSWGTPATVSFTRFGVLGGAPETHVYTVPIAEPDRISSWIYPYTNDTAYLFLHSTHPRGHAAAFGLYLWHAGEDALRSPTGWGCPVAWLELSIEGVPGADLTLAFELAYNIWDTSGEYMKVGGIEDVVTGIVAGICYTLAGTRTAVYLDINGAARTLAMRLGASTLISRSIPGTSQIFSIAFRLCGFGPSGHIRHVSNRAWAIVTDGTYRSPLATVHGPAMVPELSPPNPNSTPVYTSVNPITGEVAHTLDGPVSWT